MRRTVLQEADKRIGQDPNDDVVNDNTCNYAQTNLSPLNAEFLSGAALNLFNRSFAVKYPRPINYNHILVNRICYYSRLSLTGRLPAK